MSITVDIDNGGTFTDGYITRDNEVRAVKVDTTPHDLTACFMDCLEEGAKQLEYSSLHDFLRDTTVIRFSTTAGTNAIIQRRGPRLGLVVTAGHEQDLYSSAASVLDSLVPSDMVLGVRPGSTDEEVRNTARRLLEAGARMIVVSLEDSFENPAEERRIKRLIQENYPKQYLGAVPVLLASEVTARPGAHLRTNAAVINAFLHKEMVRTLYKTDEDLRSTGYAQPLLIAHVNGGAARVAKTKAIDTYNSGPVAGVMGTTYLAKLYGLPSVASIDIGGTSTDIGVIIDGQYTYNLTPSIGGVPINLPLVDVPSVGGGGGSIARLDPITRQLTVGPDSAGAAPGPACYDLGGMEPTATDADVVLGNIDPSYFLGGRRRLNREKAAAAIQEQIAEPLGLSLEEAAQRIRGEIIRIGASALRDVLAAKRQQPDQFVLFAFGGAGGSYCAEIGASLGIRQVYTFAHSAVFSAMGLSTADVVHSYEKAVRQPLSQATEAVNSAVADYQRVAIRDMRGEGFAESSVIMSVELEVSDGKDLKVVPLAGLGIRDAADIASIRQTFSSATDDVKVEVVRVKAVGRVPHHKPVSHQNEGSDPSAARKGSRQIYRDGRWQETPIYERGLLRCGNSIIGPAVVEAIDSTYVVPSGFRLTIDQHLNGVLTPAE
ncbi:MAG: hydantoinase/oxoprolinase family protein [Chloroflexota bacterium]|nr:MAG: hydantoinase/oxoprolinase family protein [Chloroflexota bacterium]